MRTIKFRAWHKKQKRMFPVYGFGKDFITEDTLDGVNPGTNAFSDEEMKDIEIMQFTGLKDKHGKEIYEGDILKSPHFVDHKGKQYFLYHKILWSERYYAWQAVSAKQNGDENNGNPMLFVYHKNTDYEIIGNIHEVKQEIKNL